MMVIKLSPELEAALTDLAMRQGVSAEILALDALSERYLDPAAQVMPQDEWERRLLTAATNCSVSLPHSSLTSDGLYD